MVIEGAVTSGEKGASRDVQNGRYPLDVVGFVPALGTLNLRVELGVVERLTDAAGERSLDVGGTKVRMWPALVVAVGEVAVTVPGWVMWPERGCPADARVVEVLAPVHFRSEHGAADGMRVRLAVRDRL